MVKPKVSEAELLRDVIKLARMCGYRVHHCRPAQIRSGRWVTPIQGDPGFPDLVLAKRDDILFAELKVDSGKLTEAQQDWHHVTDSIIWRPKDWLSGEIERTLRDMP